MLGLGMVTVVMKMLVLEDAAVTIRLQRRDEILVLILAVIGGAILFAVLPGTARWALSNLPWIPWGGPLELLIALEEMITGWGVTLLGAVVGGLLGLWVLDEEPVITLSKSELIVLKGDQRYRFARSQVGKACVIDRHLTVRDPNDVELLRLKIDRYRKLEELLRAKSWS